MTTFHPFPTLPAELRHQIWDLAVREDRPGVHFFILSNLEQDEHKPDQAHDISVCRYPLVVATGRSWNATSPLYNSGYLSTYMADSGMWTACQESRQAMERKFKTAYWRSRRDNLDLGTLSTGVGLENSPSTLAVRVANEQRYISIFPEVDLFLLQPSDPRSINWNCIQAETPLLSLSGGLKVNNLAFEFQPHDKSWEIAIDDDFCRMDTLVGCVARTAGDPSFIGNIWFIDHRLQRVAASPQLGNSDADQRQYSKDCDDGRCEFYSNDCRFVEVRKDDTEWTTGDAWAEGEEPVTVFDFVAEVNNAMETFYLDPRGYSDNCYGMQSDWLYPKLRVLACEAL
ncbi:hypothetical protein TOPH_06352 [Tolypocladium ophioglossoides CBS 100239]|uniref:2EXR domain-containing protein n=1 Tax=Tolypocladium ophioglossoides (strain CBS 100239) TaxID=1163406 RepID=A0A0L0N4M2_TOLOC|nr:hypothetical protein TOPH_06352 [Tolypocladium ophioglossoides CBS 100239]